MDRLSRIKLNIARAKPELLGLLRGDLPRFIYSSALLGSEIPVFSFHSVTSTTFRRLLLHLARNQYSTISMDDLVNYLQGKALPGANHVVLTFDDGWSTAWSVATPLLKEFGMKATLFIAPATLTTEKGVRKTISEGASDAEVGAEDLKSHDYLVTWEEINAMLKGGVWDIQSHTLLHARVWESNKVVEFVNPNNYKKYKELRPWNIMISGQDNIVASLDMQLGWPIYSDTARMSASRRFIPDALEGPTLADYVKRQGGEKFFHQRNWHKLLSQQLSEFRKAHPGRWEKEEEVVKCLKYELDKSREIIERRTGNHVKHLLFPWEEGSEKAVRVAKQLGYSSACWGVLRKRRSNYPGDDPYQIPRVSWKFLPLLPGKGRVSLSEELIRRVKLRTRAMFQ